MPVESEIPELAEVGLFALEQRVSPEAPTVVLSHGITVDHTEGDDDGKDGAFDLIVRELAARGLSTVRFDFRNHGRSELASNFSIDSELQDLRNVVSYVRASGRLGAMVGMSFGACATAIVANELASEIDATVFIYPVLDAYETFFDPGTGFVPRRLGPRAIPLLERDETVLLNGTFPLARSFLESTRRWSIREQVKSLEQPVLFFHGDRDTYVSWKTTRSLASEMPNASFVTYESDHGFDSESQRTFVCETTASFLRHAIR